MDIVRLTGRTLVRIEKESAVHYDMKHEALQTMQKPLGLKGICDVTFHDFVKFRTVDIT